MVRTVVLNGAELGDLRYVQDGEAVRPPTLSTRVLGFGELRASDSLQVTGQLKSYNNLLEIDPSRRCAKLVAAEPCIASRCP